MPPLILVELVTRRFGEWECEFPIHIRLCQQNGPIFGACAFVLVPVCSFDVQCYPKRIYILLAVYLQGCRHKQICKDTHCLKCRQTL